MRYDLIRPDGIFRKANLHCHTTVSDGKLTPQEVKDYYMAHGYSIVAFTDHDVMIPHPELKSPDFLPLNGYEMEVIDIRAKDYPWPKRRMCHMCLISPAEDMLEMVCWHRSKYVFVGNAKNYISQVRFDENEPDYERYRTPACINDMVRRAREAGYFVTYNHPAWSLETVKDYTRYEGFNAIEIMNYDTYINGYNGYLPEAYDEMLRAGKRLYPVATDDNHDNDPDYKYKDSCGGWVMIDSPELTYPSVMKALFDGNFYASSGPEIHELYIEDGKIHVKCSPAKNISIQRNLRANGSKTPVQGKEKFLTEAVFQFNRSAQWFRITVTDAHGFSANTRAFFTDEFPEDDG